MKENRKKIVPDKLFAKLWNDAEKIDDRNAFIRKYSSITSEHYINFKRKYSLEFDEVLHMLNEIHAKQHMSFKDIIDAAGKRKAEISNTFCIPVRTVEDWYAGKNKCASYIRLMLLKHFYLINLGKYIYLESDEERKTKKPNVYKKTRTGV